MQKKWLVKSPIQSTLVEAFRSELKVDPIVAELLLQRGITTFDEAQAFFRPSLSDLHNPFLMKGMADAVDIIEDAIMTKKRILLYGDYDVDGTTAVATMYSFLKNLAIVDFYIPDRYKEGYGISMIGMNWAVENKFDVIISLDCGIKSIQEVAFAVKNGIQFIVCDHHTPGDILPDCIVLDPKQKGCDYPFKELSGCGVGFKLLQGLCQQRGQSIEEIFPFLDFLALSIGADIVDVTGENRILCYHGLRILNENPRLAFRELLSLAKREFPVTLTDVVFTIAPRINAAGRLRSGRYAVELMISEDKNEIHQLAEQINIDNLNRREIDQIITEEALNQIANDAEFVNRVSTVVYQQDWHKGVVGIVASRLIEHHYRPTIVLTQSNGLITGSARSVNGFDVYQALNACEELLEQFGGHTHAAGLTLKEENLADFIHLFDEITKQRLHVSDRVEEQIVDLEIGFNDIFGDEENRLKIPRLKRILNQFEPHGPGNMKPVFMSSNVFSTNAKLLKDEHIKLSMTQPPCDVVIDGIAFRMPDKMDAVASGVPFDVLYTLESNKWNGRETLQLNIKDIRETI